MTGRDPVRTHEACRLIANMQPTLNDSSILLSNPSLADPFSSRGNPMCSLPKERKGGRGLEALTVGLKTILVGPQVDDEIRKDRRSY